MLHKRWMSRVHIYLDGIWCSNSVKVTMWFPATVVRCPSDSDSFCCVWAKLSL